MLELPRSARLAIWANAWRTGRVDVADVVRAVTGDDEPHTVAGSIPLPAWLADSADAGHDGLQWQVVLPAAGDPAGLPADRALVELAVEAGECVVTQGFALIPEITRFGSDIEPGHLVDWQHLSLRGPVAGLGPAGPSPGHVPGPGLGEADRLLREALAEATTTLVELDVAAWREAHAEQIAAVRDGALSAGAIPPGSSARTLEVLTRAARVRAIVALAMLDDGGAHTGWQAQQRGQALRRVDAMARAGLAAAVNLAAAQGETGR